MPIYEREFGAQLRKAARLFSAVVLSGPRRAGKTFLLRHSFPNAEYHLLEDPDVLARAKADPRGWLEGIRTPAILDEIQNAPDLFPYVRTLVDRNPRRRGCWFLTGSQDFSRMAGVSESMAGRAAVIRLAPMSFREIGTWSLVRGGFPEVLLRPRARRLWFASYVQTYLERDVRSLVAVRDLATFRRFLALLASRNGQILNRSDLAAPLGVSVPTISSWIEVLETTGHLLVVRPFFQNLGRRLIKSPKLYWIDSGLLCFLLGIETDAQLERSPFIGSVFEGFVASEIAKNRMNRGLPADVYFFRDEQGLEVDFVMIGKGGVVQFVEARWSKTIRPEDAAPMRKLMAAARSQRVEGTIVHPPARTSGGPNAVAPGVKELDVESFLNR